MGRSRIAAGYLSVILVLQSCWHDLSLAIALVAKSTLIESAC